MPIDEPDDEQERRALIREREARRVRLGLPREAPVDSRGLPLATPADPAKRNVVRLG